MTTAQIERAFNKAISVLPIGGNTIRDIVDDAGVPSQDRDPNRTNNFRYRLLSTITDIIIDQGTHRENEEEIDMAQLGTTFQVEAEIADDPEIRAILISIASTIEMVTAAA